MPNDENFCALMVDDSPDEQKLNECGEDDAHRAGIHHDHPQHGERRLIPFHRAAGQRECGEARPQPRCQAP